MHPWQQQIIDWYLDSIRGGGYPLIVLLMAMESSVIPLPSEFVIPPAAFIAASEHRLTLGGVILAGTIGCWVGASAMYWASRLAGRPLVLKYGRYVFISPEKVEQAERWTARHGSFGVFGSRMVPVVRHLIGIPAGITRMSYFKYSLQTVLGSSIWCSVLAWIGVRAGNDEALRHGDLTEVTLWAVGAVAVLGALYYFFVHRMAKE